MTSDIEGIIGVKAEAIIRRYYETRYPRFLCHWLSEILADDAELALIASRSYRHVNGHIKVVLTFDGLSLPSIRLHIWDASASAARSEIHSHPWDFISTIMTGELTNIIYEPTAAEQGFLEVHECIVRLGDKRHTGHHLIPLGMMRLKESSRHRLLVSSEYAFRAGIIHQSVPGNAGAVSLFLQMPFERHDSRTFFNDTTIADSIEVKLLTCDALSLILRSAEQEIFRRTDQDYTEFTERQL